MATKTCKNGHAYDASIYGQNCPFCPQEDGTEKTMANSGSVFEDPTVGSWGQNDPTNPTRPTIPIGEESDNDGQRTRIRILGGDNTIANTNGGRFLVGLLVSYNTNNPCGEVYKIYEGKTVIGRKRSCNISFPDDEYMSDEHLRIQYLQATGRFVAEDCMSTGGTFVNGKPYDSVDKIVLKNGDIIILGHTKFVFLAIPPLYLTKDSDNG